MAIARPGFGLDVYFLDLWRLGWRHRCCGPAPARFCGFLGFLLDLLLLLAKPFRDNRI